MDLNFRIDIHPTHIAIFHPTMTQQPVAPTAPTAPTEMEALVALVARLSAASLEATRLSVEVAGTTKIYFLQFVVTLLSARLQATSTAVASAAAATEAVSADTAAAAATAAADSDASDTSDFESEFDTDSITGPLWVRRTPKTPAQLEMDFPEGSGETWYVVLIGREPGLYRTQ